MQPRRRDASFDSQFFDIRQVAAALPPSGSSPTQQNFHPPVKAVAHAPPAWYPVWGNVQQSGIQSWRGDGANNLGGIAQPGNFGGMPGLPPLLPLATRGPVAPEANPAQRNHPLSPSLSVPTSPRGPPRKPKRSGFALWVGNLPRGARIEELKDHFSTGATEEIESVFLIWKSNCAFVNYSTESACSSAMNRFHNSRFRGRTLACRIRRSRSSASDSSRSSAQDSNAQLPALGRGLPSPSQTTIDSEPKSPVIVGREEDLQPSVSTPSTPAEEDSKSDAKLIPTRYFILKSLTLEDLEVSVITGFWATQPHNEEVLNEAFAGAEEVFLIFSANRSGGYFGYARMMSAISNRAPEITAVVATTPTADKSVSDAPRTIPTRATATAPKGRIIDDSARGSIFWEADRASGSTELGGSEYEDGQTKATKEFALEWISTTKVPFVHTRGMRNPWNGNREIKIARDGQELDPRVGRLLLQLFNDVKNMNPKDVELSVDPRSKYM